MSPGVRKQTFCICENKDADQLRGNLEADQRLWFRYLDSTIHLLPKYKILSLCPSPVAVQPGLCQTWSESKLLVFSRRGSNLLNLNKPSGLFNSSQLDESISNVGVSVWIFISIQLLLHRAQGTMRYISNNVENGSSVCTAVYTHAKATVRRVLSKTRTSCEHVRVIPPPPPPPLAPTFISHEFHICEIGHWVKHGMEWNGLEWNELE